MRFRSLLLFAGSSVLGSCAAVIGADFDRSARSDASPLTDAGPVADATDVVEPAAPEPVSYEVVREVPNGASILAIYCPDEATAFAVGTSGLHLHYRSGRWERVEAGPVDRDYRGLWGTSATDLYAVGSIRNTPDGIIQHFDGVRWTDDAVVPHALHGIWGASGEILAVGERGAIYRRSAGPWPLVPTTNLPANPNVPATPDGPVLRAIAGNGLPAFAIAADANRVFRSGTAGGFTAIDPFDDPSLIFRAAFARPGGPTDIYLGASYYGIWWLAARSEVPADLDAGRFGDLYRIYEDRSLPGAPALSFHGIWGDGVRTIFVGDRGRVVEVDRQAKVVAKRSPSNKTLRAVCGTSLANVWIVGDDELVVRANLER